jgi:nucleoside-diphosphate-sugar epimerase
MKIIIPGGAGLVGQNLIARLKNNNLNEIIVIDKQENNLNILKNTHPDIQCKCADLSLPGSWEKEFNNADIVIMLQAQIGGNQESEFYKNNIQSSQNVLDAMKKFNINYLIHVSSSVVKSLANDMYTKSKKEQEKLVIDSGISNIILRPTLMFGWFDRKHLGWLSRFMKKIPIFPIPGNGKFMRQPLYVGDFCEIIISCLNKTTEGVFDISGREKIDYIDIIYEIKKTINSKCIVLKIPFYIFNFLLYIWALFDKNPPFTTQQLSALVTKDDFDIINWPEIFDVTQTPFTDAIKETFNHPIYSDVTLKF